MTNSNNDFQTDAETTQKKQENSDVPNVENLTSDNLESGTVASSALESHHVEADIPLKKIDFGSVLKRTREQKKLSIDEIKDYLKIPAQTIKAIENNQINQLPAPTFTQGYIRAYARYLELPEEDILTGYNLAVPHDSVSNLKPRTTIEKSKDLQKPLIKIVNYLIIIIVLSAIVFGFYNYYQQKSNSLSLENEKKAQQANVAGTSVDVLDKTDLVIDSNVSMEQSHLRNALSSTQNLVQQSAIDDKDSDNLENTPTTTVLDGTQNIQLNSPQVADTAGQNTNKQTVASVLEDEFKIAKQNINHSTEKVIGNNQSTELPVQQNTTPANTAVLGNDKLEVYAKEGSWLEVYDVKKNRLYYKIIPAGMSQIITGKAPFKILLGNAKFTQLTLNSLKLNISDFIQNNNTASFTVSSKAQDIIYY